MKSFTNKKQNSWKNTNICCICNKIFADKHDADKQYFKVRDYYYYAGEYRGAAHSICDLQCSVPKKIPIVFHNRSNYDYHFIIKELAE